MRHLTIKQALPIFYKDYHLEADGGINDPTVKVELLKGISVYMPNFEARRKVVLKHDIHHILTGYPAAMKGETEISAWEIATGCTHNWFAFMINTYGMMSGLVFNFRAIWKAWSRGKETTNLYQEKSNDEDLLDRSVNELKHELGLDRQNGSPIREARTVGPFLAFLAFGTLFSLVSLVLLPFLLLYSVVVSITKLWEKT